MGAPTEAECLEFLHQIERGELTLEPVHCAQDVFAGDVEYLASNGWSLVVFNDANEWDYIERIATNDGRRLNFDEISESMPELSRYSPTHQVSWKVYRIPGYCDHRCELCDRDIQGGWTILDRRMCCDSCLPPAPGTSPKPKRAPHKMAREQNTHRPTSRRPRSRR